jgi:hypothetical protein
MACQPRQGGGQQPVGIIVLTRFRHANALSSHQRATARSKAGRFACVNARLPMRAAMKLLISRVQVKIAWTPKSERDTAEFFHTFYANVLKLSQPGVCSTNRTKHLALTQNQSNCDTMSATSAETVAACC